MSNYLKMFKGKGRTYRNYLKFGKSMYKPSKKLLTRYQIRKREVPPGIPELHRRISLKRELSRIKSRNNTPSLRSIRSMKSRRSSRSFRENKRSMKFSNRVVKTLKNFSKRIEPPTIQNSIQYLRTVTNKK